MLPEFVLRLLHSAFLLFCGYRSFKAIRSTGADDDTRWLTFWLLYTLFEAATTFLDFTIGLVLPFYGEIKLGIVVFLGAFGGSSMLFPLIEPFLLEGEKKAKAKYGKQLEQAEKLQGA